MSAFSRPLLFTPPFDSLTGSPAATNVTFDSTSDHIAWVFQVAEPVTVTQVGIRQGTVTGTPGVIRVRFEGVNATGTQDGTMIGTGTPYADYTPVAGNNNTVQWLTLGTAVTLTRGQFVALVAQPNSGTWDASNLCTITSKFSQFPGPPGLPYVVELGTKSNSTLPCFGYASSSVSYGLPIQTSTASNYSSSTTPDEYGVRFTLTAGLGSTYTVAGMVFAVNPPASQTGTMTLYDASSTVLQTKSFDTDQVSVAGIRAHTFLFTDTTLSTLSFGTEYVLTWAPGSTTNHSTPYIEVARAQDWGAFGGGSVLAQWTERTNGTGAWTDRATRLPFMAPIIGDWSEPTGAGGGPLVGSGRLVA